MFSTPVLVGAFFVLDPGQYGPPGAPGSGGKQVNVLSAEVVLALTGDLNGLGRVSALNNWTLFPAHESTVAP